MRSTLHGVGVKRVVPKKDGDLRTVEIDFNRRSSDLMLVEDLVDWKMSALRACCPRELRQQGQSDNHLTVMLVTC